MNAKDAVNTALKAHGWVYSGMQMKPGMVAVYQIVRLQDGRTATFSRTLEDIVSSTLDEIFASVVPEIEVSFTLLLGLLQLAKSENEKHPL